MSNTKRKRLGGFSKIHVATLTDGIFGIPTPIGGAKAIEAELTYEAVQFYADNAIDYNDFIFNGGEGTLTVSGLTMDEYNLLFGSTVGQGDVLIKSQDQAPELALLFERNKLGTQDKVLYVIYNVKFAPPAISATTMEGAIEEEPIELTFSVNELPDGSVFYMTDTGIADAFKVDSWYETVQTQ